MDLNPHRALSRLGGAETSKLLNAIINIVIDPYKDTMGPRHPEGLRVL